MILRTGLLAASAFLALPASAAESYDNCSGFINTLPTTISTEGTWCLRKDLATSISTGRAILIASNNVTLDCNDFKVGNLSAGDATQAIGIEAVSRFNVTVRNCSVRGFLVGMSLSAADLDGLYTVEDNNVQAAKWIGIDVRGDGSVLRRNALSDIGGTSLASSAYHRASGISVGFGSIDLLDNTITHVTGKRGAYGIHTYDARGGSVAGNRVSGVVSEDTYELAYGIMSYESGGQVIRDNDVLTAGAGYALYCAGGSKAARARDNTIIGSAGLGGCEDAGGNDLVP